MDSFFCAYGVAAIQSEKLSWLEVRRKLVAALTVTLELIPPARLDLEIDAVLAAMERGTRSTHTHAMAPLVSPKAAVLVRHLQEYKVKPLLRTMRRYKQLD